MIWRFWLPYVGLWQLHQYAIDARRRSRTRSYYLWSALAGLAAAIMIAGASWLAYLFWYVGAWWMAVILGATSAAPLLANLALRHVLAPLGATRLAFYAGRMARAGGRDGEAYALCCAAWAFGGRPTPSAEAWLERRRRARVPLGDAEVVATGLVAAGRGDFDTARALLRSVSLLVEDHPAVRELAGEWLAADAAERGAWSELHETAGANRWPATPLTFLLEGIAARRVGATGAPSRGELTARWFLAPHRRATQPLLADPPAAAPPVTGAGDPAPVAAPTDATTPPLPLPHAVAAHLAFRAAVRSSGSAGELAATVRAWDTALADRATHTWIARRALELDAPVGAAERALSEVAAIVTDELARIADAHQLGAPPSAGLVGGALTRRLRHGRLDALDAAFAAWSQRRFDGTHHPAIDEWREFLALRAAYDATVASGGIELRRLAFPIAWLTGSNMAAWLWNKREEYVVSHAVSKWLLSEALEVGDTEAIELGHKNCRLTVPTRLGSIREQIREEPESRLN